MPDSSGIEIGYRLYRQAQAEAVLVSFHGNAELAAEWDYAIKQFLDLKLTVLAVDYRG